MPSFARPNFTAWVAANLFQAGRLGLTTAIDYPNFVVDPPMARPLPSLTNEIIASIPAEAQCEAMHGIPDLQLHLLRRQMDTKYNQSTTAVVFGVH